MPSQTFFVQGRYLGECEIPSMFLALGEVQRARSAALYCGHCGEIWARLCNGSPWTCVFTKDCAQHGDGRLWYKEMAYQPAFELERWPTDVLRYELERSIQVALGEKV